MPTRNLSDWIALKLLPGIGPIVTRRALERFGDPGTIAYRVPRNALLAIPGVNHKRAAEAVEGRKGLERRVDRELRRSKELKLKLLPLGHPDYPAELATLPDAPVVLYLRGTLPPAIVRVAVVGSRRATHYGKRIATGLACGLAARGIDVVSGGARGIDTCAHRGALGEGGRTVAVLGAGFLHLYPSENAALFDRIADQGAVLSEFALDQGPKPENFPRRNRLISGLSVAVVVVEAAVRSGSLVTAGHALDQDREVMAVPGPVSSERSQGCHRLIQQGAKLVQNIDDVIDELSPMYRDAIAPGPEPASERAVPEPVGTPDEQAILALIRDSGGPVQLDELADRAPFGIARLQAALFGLELRSAVEGLPGGHYSLGPAAASVRGAENLQQN